MVNIEDNEITFAGHFTIGEKVTRGQSESIEDLLDMETIPAIVVNDIGFEDRLSGYFFGDYQFVMRCSRPACGMSRGRIILEEMIDRDVYKQASEEVIGYVKSNDLLGDIDLAESVQLAMLVKYNPTVKKYVREVIVPRIVQEMLVEYGVDVYDQNIFYETKLRNRAATRMKRSRSEGARSWVKNLEEIGEYDSLRGERTGVPTCGAILLALYDELASRGYDKIVQLYDAQDRNTIENGVRVYNALRDKFPRDTRWRMDFETKFF